MADCQDRFCILRGEHCDDRFDYLEKNLLLQLTANERALLVAKSDMERRLEGMNEFRAQLTTQANSFISRIHYDVEYKSLLSEITFLREWKSRCEGATSWSNIIAFVAVGLSALAMILHFTR